MYIRQTIKKEYENSFEIARKYYSILFEINNIYLTKLELDLMAFTASRGFITTVPSKKDFIEQFKTNSGTVNNIVAKLKRKGYLIKQDGKIKVNPKILLDFNKEGIILQLNFGNGEKRPVDKEDECTA